MEMGYYALFYEVVENFVERRAPFRTEHLKLADEANLRGELVLAGALAEPADGALIIFRGEDASVASSFAEKDPYVLNGLVKHWEVRPWTVVVGGEAKASLNDTRGES
ncbi:MAG TPA: YciI-like protein [Candidatus Acidoferrum sp.]|nr:YciI-like protein [Candidatus Acidoferrum sp.]